MNTTAAIVIVGCGMMTPVGLSTPETAASTRSRTARLGKIEWRDDHFEEITVGFVPDDALPELKPELAKLPRSERESRMLRLANQAIDEALQTLPKTKRPLVMAIGLPELHTTEVLNPNRFLSRLAVQTGISIDLNSSLTLPQGRSSALMAMKVACERLAQKKDDFVLVGGVDCQVDLYVLGMLHASKRVRSDNNSDGFSPSEGAGFVLLTTKANAEAYKLKAYATVAGCAVAKEPGHMYSSEPYLGEGLASAVTALFDVNEGLPPIGCVYNSFNGELFWGKEHGVAVIRNRNRFLEDFRTEHPAECFGDLGAAHGAVLLGLAAAAQKHARPGTATLVSASSDFGSRAVVALVDHT